MSKSAGARRERAVASKQFHDGRFRNITRGVAATRAGTLSLTGEFFFGGRARRPKAPLPLERPHAIWTRSERELRITWLGHSTMVIESAGRRVLTDPVFAERASPVSFVGPRRFHPVPATVAELPPLDAILVSHDHLDHLCRASIGELAKLGVPFVTGLGVGAHLERYGVAAELITELDWWERATVGGVEFSAVPAHHFSGRSLTDRNATLWSSWVITTDQHRAFFSGDTGLHEAMPLIAERFGRFDVTMLEIGAYNQAWGDIHLGPANALKALELLGGGTLLPMHWCTFDLGLHPWAQPAEQLFGLAAATSSRILTPHLGRPFRPARAEAPEPWWREVEGALERIAEPSAAAEPVLEFAQDAAS